MSVFTRLPRRSRRLASVASVTVAGLVLSTMAVLYQGVTAEDVDLNDAGVWVTKPSALLAGRVNAPSQVLDAGLRAGGTSFDLEQEAGTVLLHDDGDATVSTIDVASVTLSEAVAVPADASIVLGGGRVSILDRATGRLWARDVAALSSFSVDADEADAELGAGAVATTAADGTVLAFSPADAELTLLAPDGAAETRALEGFADDAAVSITAVGDVPVVLDAAAGRVSLDGGAPIDVAGDGAVLQDPGAAADAVAIATGTALVLQPLDGSAALVLDAGAPGSAVVPVSVNGCTYAAWTVSGRYLRDCAGTADDSASDVASLVGERSAVFRVNRAAVVLNEVEDGSVWLVDQDMKEVSNWEDVTPPENDTDEPNDDESTKDQVQNTIPERSAENAPPVAEDDEFGVRAGRSAILPILDNDNDPDGDVLTATVTGAGPSIGKVTPIYGGQALQIEVPADATGTATFAYTATDGRGLSDDAVVSLDVRPVGSNDPPEQKREGRIELEQGASVTYNVLPDWIDPDGDDLFLRTAASTADDRVEFRADGLVTVEAIGAEFGRKDVVLVVSDGEEEVEGVLHVDVRAPGSLIPMTNPDHVTTLADETVTVAPLGNDLSPTGEPLLLSKVDEVDGAVVVPDYTAGTFSFTSATPGSYYTQYLATDGPNSAPGIVRIDVLPAALEPSPPVAVRDVALLPAGGTVLVDVLQNDSDPDGGLLVVSSVEVPPTTGVSVAILEHAVLRVTDQPGITAPVVFRYTVSNGTAPATGEVLVVPTPAPAGLEPPVASDDTAVVRAGDVVTIDVLANDVSPTGDVLTVAPDLVAPLPEAADGLAFVSEDTLRFRAGDTAKTVYLTYEAVDGSGQKDAGYVTVQILPMNREANSPPRPVNVEARALSGSTVRVPIPLDGIDPDGDSVTLVGQASAPSLGVVEEIGEDFLTYTAFDASAGTDSFRYEVRDALGATSSATVRIGVARPSTQNQSPEAVKDLVTAQPDRRIAVDVLANDTDPDGDVLTLVEDGLTVPEGMTASITSGRVLVTVPAGEGEYALQYAVADGRGSTAIGSLLVTVQRDAALLAPIARDDTVTAADLAAGARVEVAVLANDEDPDGISSELDVALLGQPEGATVTADGVVTVTPGAVAQVIAYTATDADSLVGTAFLRVPAVGSTGPSLKPGIVPLEVEPGEQVRIAVADYVTAPEGRAVQITQADRVSALHSADGVLVQDPTTLLYTAAPDYFGPDALTFEVTDGTGPDDPAGVTATLSIPITVLPAANQPPVFTAGSMEVAAGEEPGTLDLRALSSDPDKGDLEKLSYTVSGGADGITASVSGSVLEVSADESVAKGTVVTLEVGVSDGSTETVRGSVVVTVSASTRPLTVTNDDVVAEAAQGEPTPVDVLANDVNPFPESPLTLVGEPIVDTGAGTATTDGDRVVVTPAEDFVGTMVVRYQVADATGDVDRHVYGAIRLTVQGRPAAPGTPSVSSVQDRTVVLSWSDGTSNGSPITTHTVKWNGGSQDCPATTCTIEGLTNDREYTFTVTATNSVGESDPSPVSAVARPDARPGAPTITSLDYGDGSLTVTWEDGENPGSAVTGYIIQLGGAGNGQVEVPGGTRTKELTGLTNGANYSVAVQASNRSPEASDWSGPMSMSPAGAPSAPGAPSVAASVELGTQTQLPVSWAAPESVNAEALTGYTLQVKKGGAIVDTIETGPSETSKNVTVDNAETGYTFAVAATNKSTDAGKTTPQFSDDSTARRAVGKPDTPTITSAKEGDNSIIEFAWSRVSGNGASSGEIAYYYDLNGDGVDRPASQTLTQGITNGSPYAVRVRAIATVEGNAYPSEWSGATAQLAPYGPVRTPTVSAVEGAKNVTFNWAPPSANGRAISRLVISIDGGGWEDVAVAPGSRSVGDAYSQGHSIRVKAIDSVGQESAEASGSGTSGPQPPVNVSANWGRSATPAQGCSSNNCPFADVSVSNATPDSRYTVIWNCGNADPAANCGSGNEMYRMDVSADSSGNFSVANKVFFGYGGQVWITVYGDRGPVRSNTLSR
ncbi:Ig-like domain-containing protein [Rathayibacter caricis]|uniref:Ig-like domain-containing protein n=1 Tax=Rathayibacter caricis TaxID=110936 RepID=UPI001FB4696A|nr:Ig-like domain-containing protein [Rathayibacter caricis]MCJ1696309.1 Ig-like domain-containing protein [Rathayibacter caricis]